MKCQEDNTPILWYVVQSSNDISVTLTRSQVPSITTWPRYTMEQYVMQSYINLLPFNMSSPQSDQAEVCRSKRTGGLLIVTTLKSRRN